MSSRSFKITAHRGKLPERTKPQQPGPLNLELREKLQTGKVYKTQTDRAGAAVLRSTILTVSRSLGIGYTTRSFRTDKGIEIYFQGLLGEEE